MTNAASRPDNVKLAVAAVLLAVLALSLGDAVIKLVSVSLPLWQLYVLRSLLVVPVLVAVIRYREPGLRLLPRGLGWTALRSLLLASMWVAYYTALPHVQLSLAAAAYYTGPLFITLLAGVFTADRVGWTGWLAILLGFAGVLLMLRPDAGAINPYALLPILAAFLYALAMILTRTRCRDEHPLILSLSLMVTFIVMGAVSSLLLLILDPAGALAETNAFLFGPWVSLDSTAWLAIAALALAILIGSVFAAVAYQNGPASLVATFDYAYLAFSVLWGFLVFSELPDGLAVVGMVMIFAAGLLAMRR